MATAMSPLRYLSLTWGGDPGSNVLHVCSSSNLLSYLVPLNYLSLCVVFRYCQYGNHCLDSSEQKCYQSFYKLCYRTDKSLSWIAPVCIAFTLQMSGIHLFTASFFVSEEGFHSRVQCQRQRCGTAALRCCRAI